MHVGNVFLLANDINAFSMAIVNFMGVLITIFVVSLQSLLFHAVYFVIGKGLSN